MRVVANVDKAPQGKRQQANHDITISTRKAEQWRSASADV